jgi:CRP-like cAMP-binding protein
MQKNIFKSVSCENCHSHDKGIFCELEHSVLTEISHHKVMNSYKKGQTIFFQGNPPFGLYCIASGKIKVSKVGNDGKETIIRIAGPGDVLGHRSLFSKENYSATATALEDAAICFVDKSYIYTLIKDEPSIALNMIEKLSKDMGAAETRNASMSQKSARERLAELFLTFMTNYGHKEADGRVRLDIKLNRDEIASIVGTAHETIIRLISEFKEMAILEQEGKVIYILDESKLLELANLDY